MIEALRKVFGLEDARARELARRRAYWATFLGTDGKPHPNALLVLKSLRRFCGVDRPGIVVSPVQRMTDPYATAYQAGMRDVYHHLTKMLEAVADEPKENDDVGRDAGTE